jgi:hypothetical protein
MLYCTITNSRVLRKMKVRLDRSLSNIFPKTQSDAITPFVQALVSLHVVKTSQVAFWTVMKCTVQSQKLGKWVTSQQQCPAACGRMLMTWAINIYHSAVSPPITILATWQNWIFSSATIAGQTAVRLRNTTPAAVALFFVTVLTLTTAVSAACM